MKRSSILLISQFSSVAQSCLTLCDPMDYSVPGFPVHHQLSELTQTHVNRVSDAIQPSHPVIPFSSCPQSLWYMCLFQFLFPQVICLGVGLLGHMVVLFLVFKGLSIPSSIVAVSTYIPTNSSRVFPFLQTLSSIYCL